MKVIKLALMRESGNPGAASADDWAWLRFMAFAARANFKILCFDTLDSRLCHPREARNQGVSSPRE